MLAGVTVVWRSRLLRLFAAGALCNALVITALQAVLVVVAAQRFGSDTLVGWLYAAVGAGGVAGSLALLRSSSRTVSTRTMTLSIAGELIPLGLIVVAPSLIVACALLFLSATSSMVYQTLGAVALQRTVPAALLGRSNAVIRFSLYAGMLLGAVAAVVLLEWLSWDQMVVIVTAVAAALLLAAIATGRSRDEQDVELAGRRSVRERSSSEVSAEL
jgi:MFS family permease